MDATEYFKEYFDADAELSYSLDAVEFAEYYHLHKSKEEAKERLANAWEYLERRASKEEGGVVSYGRGGYIIDSLILAAFGKEES